MDVGTTVVIASHNLRELEDICDQIGLLHQGKLVFQRSWMIWKAISTSCRRRSRWCIARRISRR